MGANHQYGMALQLFYQAALMQLCSWKYVLQAVLTSAVESGISTFLFPAEHQHFAQDWKGIVAFDALVYDGDAIRSDSHQVRGCRGCNCSNFCCPTSLTRLCSLKQVGRIRRVASGLDMQAAAKDCNEPGFLVMDCSDWQIIPAENLVAAFQVWGFACARNHQPCIFSLLS